MPAAEPAGALSGGGAMLEWVDGATEAGSRIFARYFSSRPRVASAACSILGLTVPGGSTPLASSAFTAAGSALIGDGSAFTIVA
jgi:hypothetical protein